MAHALRIEDYLPSPAELRAPKLPSTRSSIAEIRESVAEIGQKVRSVEVAATKCIVGSRDLVAAARAESDAPEMNRVVGDLEELERQATKVCKKGRASALQLKRLVNRKAKLPPDIKLRLNDFLQRFLEASAASIRAIRGARWQIMAVLAEREPMGEVGELRSLDDVAALFGDDELTAH